MVPITDRLINFEHWTARRRRLRYLQWRNSSSTTSNSVIRNGNNPDAITFTNFLFDVGENNIYSERIINTNTIRIPGNFLIPSHMPNTPDAIISQIFPNIFSGEIGNDSAILTQSTL